MSQGPGRLVLESCGVVALSPNGVVLSALIMQTVQGLTKQQILDSLIARYGPPADRFDTVLLQSFRAEQFVWGLSKIGLDKTAYDLTKLSGAKHWQVEAVITQPTPERYSVFVQMNLTEIPAGKSGDKAKKSKSGLFSFFK